VARRLIFNGAIPDDLAAAIDYYMEISPALADRFRAAVGQRLDDIAERPESFPLDIPPIRFAKIHRFPYLVLFVVKSTFVSVVAIVHGSTKPGRWRTRK
jgi:plasmid stabilization system protein ParE